MHNIEVNTKPTETSVLNEKPTTTNQISIISKTAHYGQSSTKDILKRSDLERDEGRVTCGVMKYVTTKTTKTTKTNSKKAAAILYILGREKPTHQSYIPSIAKAEVCQ